jgi:hypothetical protein
MLLTTLIGIYCENHAEQIHTLCEQNTGETYTYHLAFNVNVRMDSERLSITLHESVFRPKGALYKSLLPITFT